MINNYAGSQQTLKKLVSLNSLSAVEQIHHFIGHAVRQIDQIRRRVLNGENIAHDEKVFSIFEEHTKWVSTKSRRHKAKEKQVYWLSLV